MLGGGSDRGHDADDAFQATFLVLVRRAATVSRGEPVGPWLHGVAVRVCRRARARTLRRQSRERTGPAGERATLGAPAAPLPDPLDRAETRAIIDEAIARLPERERRVVVLADIEGLPRLEVADRLGWTETTVRGRLARGRARLRADLDRRGWPRSAPGAPPPGPGSWPPCRCRCRPSSPPPPRWWPPPPAPPSWS